MLAILLASAMVAEAPLASAGFRPGNCPAAFVAAATCGTVDVPEDRSSRGGRRIALNLAILRSKSPVRLPPLFDFDGGPGLPATKNAGFYASNGISNGRDVVMIDQRGTGASNGLHCPQLSSVEPTEPMLPAPLVRACLDDLKTKADLRFYGTADAVADVEAVRTALGYAKIDLFGLSYGTTVALRYMQRYPGNVRAAVLMGTAPPFAMPPRDHAPAGARTLGLMVADCAAKPACNARFPRLQRDIEEAKNKAKSPELLMERIRTALYAPGTRAALPLAIERAAAGDFARLFGGGSQTGPTGLLADGMFLAVTCGESFALMDYPAAAAAARRTMFGDYRLRRQREACLGWPRVRVDPDHLRLPTETDAAILLISGNLDPVTPPEWADRVAAALKNARHVVIPDGGHIPDGLANLEACLDGFTIDFLDHGDVAKVDLSCVASMKAPDYLTE